VSAPPAHQVHPQAEQRSIFRTFSVVSGRFWAWISSFWPSFWRRRLKNVVKFFRKRCTPRQNPGYAYDVKTRAVRECRPHKRIRSRDSADADEFQNLTTTSLSKDKFMINFYEALISSFCAKLLTKNKKDKQKNGQINKCRVYCDEIHQSVVLIL